MVINTNSNESLIFYLFVYQNITYEKVEFWYSRCLIIKN